MLSIVNVTKKYRRTLANNNISLEVAPGETAVLLGPNGAGKSTLIKCICGLLRYEGKITVGSFDNKTVEAKKLLGYVPELPAVYDLLTVGEHLEFVMRAYKAENRGYGDELLRRFELYDKKNTLAKELSKGMQQKLSICCALVHRPRVIIFDEPMVGLDPHAIKQLKEIFEELRNDGVAVIISTHMIDSIEDCWDKAYIMVDGCIRHCKRKNDGNIPLEELFFAVTEKGAQ